MRGPWAAQEALGMTWKDGVEEGREAQEGGDACTDLNYHTAKANTTFKKKKRKKERKKERWAKTPLSADCYPPGKHTLCCQKSRFQYEMF